jgi:hypothetical protein
MGNEAHACEKFHLRAQKRIWLQRGCILAHADPLEHTQVSNHTSTRRDGTLARCSSCSSSARRCTAVVTSLAPLAASPQRARAPPLPPPPPPPPLPPSTLLPHPSSLFFRARVRHHAAATAAATSTSIRIFQVSIPLLPSPLLLLLHSC